jgi:uncharacterized protein (TIGR02996 family)
MARRRREYLGSSLDCTRQRLSWIEQLQKNPEDRDTWQIYGDWLAAQGDTRGELILLDLRLEVEVSSEETAKLEERKSALERDLEEGFRARSMIGEREQLSWKRGYLHALTTFTQQKSRVLRILKSEEAMFLKEWRCHSLSNEEFKELATPAYLPCLTSLSMQDISAEQASMILADSPLLQHLKTLSLRHIISVPTRYGHWSIHPGAGLSLTWI